MRTYTLLALALCGCAGDEDTGGDPGASGNYTREATTDGGAFEVRYAPDPDPIPFDEYFALDLAIEPSDAAITPDMLTVEATAEMPEHGHGMNVTPAVTLDESGGWRAEPFLFHMEGAWTINVVITANGDVERASFDVDCCE